MSAYLLRRRGLGNTSCREIAALSQTGIQVRRVRRGQPEPFADGDVVIRWGYTGNTTGQVRMINKAAAIHAVNHKTGFRQALKQATPDIIPPTVFSLTEARQVQFPLVLRPAIHAQGRRLHVVRDYDALVQALPLVGAGWYASTLIDKRAEYRVYVMQGRVIAVASKTPVPGQVAWNVAQGGHFDNVRWDAWPIASCKVALAAMAQSGLDFGGVDVMEDQAGRAYVIEINSAPSLTSPYRQQAMARGFDWLVEGKVVEPPHPRPLTWKGLIHPAVRAAAAAEPGNQ